MSALAIGEDAKSTERTLRRERKTKTVDAGDKKKKKRANKEPNLFSSEHTCIHIHTYDIHKSSMRATSNFSVFTIPNPLPRDSNHKLKEHR